MGRSWCVIVVMDEERLVCNSGGEKSSVCNGGGGVMVRIGA